MRFPQIVIRDSDGWVAKQLHDLAAEHHWLIRSPRTPASALALVRETRPSVLVVQVEPAEPALAAFSLLADVHRLCPDVPSVAVSDVKMPDADRAAWTAALMDLGARYVLFPPLARSILEDTVSGLLLAAIRRTVPGAEEKPADRGPIDLAHGEAEG